MQRIEPTVIEVQVRERLLERGWRVGRNNHLYRVVNHAEWRIVFRRRTVAIDKLSKVRDARGRHPRIRISTAFYKDVKLHSDCVVIGSNKL